MLTDPLKLTKRLRRKTTGIGDAAREHVLTEEEDDDDEDSTEKSMCSECGGALSPMLSLHSLAKGCIECGVVLPVFSGEES